MQKTFALCEFYINNQKGVELLMKYNEFNKSSKIICKYYPETVEEAKEYEEGKAGAFLLASLERIFFNVGRSPVCNCFHLKNGPRKIPVAKTTATL